jgi:hypothetical protein
MADDIRDTLRTDAAAMQAFQYVCGLSPENFLRFTRMCIEYREAVDQRAIAHVSRYFRDKKE